MLSLDEILDGLTVETRPFAICEARGDGVIELGQRGHATLHYVLSGSGTFAMDGLPEIKSDAGTILIAPAHTPHRLHARPLAECAVLNCAPLGPGWEIHNDGHGSNGVIAACSEIAVSYRGIDRLFDYLQSPLVCRLGENDSLKVTLDRVLQELALPQVGARALVRLLMQQCMIYVLRQAGPDINWLTAAHDVRLWRAVTTIFDDPAGMHSLDSLAAVASMSRSSFAEHFKQSFGRGPIELVKQARLQLAVRLLVSTDIAINAIAREVGYSSRSYFSRAFSDQFGLSPVEFRNANRRPVQ